MKKLVFVSVFLCLGTSLFFLPLFGVSYLAAGIIGIISGFLAPFIGE